MRPTVTLVESLTRWIGSVASLIAHTLVFITAFALGFVHVFSWDNILLILTTLVSLEAIYLAIFIQMSVNQNTASLKEVEEGVDEIQEDVVEIQEDVDEIQKDIDAIEQDVDEIQEDEAEEIARDAEQRQALESISQRLQQLVADIHKLR